MDHEQPPRPPMIRFPGSEHPVSQPDYGTQAMTSTTGYNHGAEESGSPHSGSTAERRLVGPPEVHFTSGPYATDIEHGPILPPRPVRSQDGHTPQRRTLGYSATGIPMAAQDLDFYLGHTIPSVTQMPPNHPTTDQFRTVNEKGARTEGKSRTCLSWLLLCCRRRNRKDKINAELRQWPRGTLGERLTPTIRYAMEEREKCAEKALLLGWVLNIAIGLQVLLGALTTALAAAVTSTKQAQVSTAVLGGLATLVASYLARVRGSGEPELSVMQVKDLEHFIRDCKAFELDHGYDLHTNHRHCPVNERLMELRQKLENLLGNGNGERKLSATGIATVGTTSASAATSPPTNPPRAG